MPRSRRRECGGAALPDRRWVACCCIGADRIRPGHEVPMGNPPRLKASDFDPELLQLFDRYVHGLVDRRGFLAGAARFAVGATTAAGLLAALSPQFAAAQQVKPDDRRLAAKYLEFDSPKGYGKARG